MHNRFYDPALNDTFYIGGPSSHNPDWWNEGEPVGKSFFLRFIAKVIFCLFSCG